MTTVTLPPAEDLDRLAAAAAAHAASPAPNRAALALRTARSVAVAADRWMETAVGIEARHEAAGDGGSRPPPEAAWAEEAATGPLATLRLLLLTARALADVARRGLPRSSRPPRLLHASGGSGPASFVAVDVLPGSGVWDGAIFRDHTATVRCVDPGGLSAFERSWREEVHERTRSGGVALVLGAGNVTGLSVADAICQIFEHGRVALIKLHPLHAPLEPVLREALAPLVAADVLAITTGGADVARAAVADPRITHVHLTGGRAAFDALVWGGADGAAAGAAPVLQKPLTCELGSVTPWFVVPGRYTPAELRFQADTVAASIVNNTSFNCIATKCVVTCRGWDQREEFLRLVRSRLDAQPSRTAWYPGSSAAWETLAGRPPPSDGTLPWLFRTDLDPTADGHWLDREWFLPAAVELPLDADSLESFCSAAAACARRLPGSLAASITVPKRLSQRDAARVELLVEHLEYGVVAVNTWSALAYAIGSVPWGGFPGATLADPGSGIGHVHDPLLLPLVHNAIVRAPLASRIMPAWFPWHPRANRLARGVIGMYAAIADGRSGTWQLAAMLPDVFVGSAG